MRLWIFCFIIVFFAALAVFLFDDVHSHVPKHIAFPIPPVFALPTNNQVETLDLWTMQQHIAETNNPLSPNLSATSALVYDDTTNTILFAKNATQKLPMASLTKIMTALIALENPLPSDRYTVSQSDLVGEDSMGLDVGETVSLEELLYGLMLHSGNDSAEVLAHNFPSGRAGFIDAMNKKAESLGLGETHFTNPTGLEGDGNQYTTSRDLLLISHYLMLHFPLFAKVVQTFDYVIPQSENHKAFYLENETNLLTSYPGVEGIKTGYTPEAGLCLVTYLNYKGHHIYAVLLQSDDRRGEMKELLDFSLRKEHITPPHHS